MPLSFASTFSSSSLCCMHVLAYKLMMPRTFLLPWYCFFLMLVSTGLVPMVKPDALPNLGMNWGVLSNRPLSPKIVVNMLKDNGIKKVKLFEADPYYVNALAGTGIEVMLAIPNFMLASMAKFDKAKAWVKENVTRHLGPKGVDIRYIAVGNEPFLKMYRGRYSKAALSAMKNVYKAIVKAGLADKIKVTSPQNADVYETKTNKPSDGDFRQDIKSEVVDIIKFLQQTKAPFLVNIHPFINLYEAHTFPFNYTFFDGGVTVRDKGLTYTNVFEASYDTLVWSLKKNGAPDMKIFVGEIGWPTDANPFANLTTGKRFYDGLLKRLGSGKGTPLRPQAFDRVYLFSIFDENQKDIAPGDFERHWGIFRYDGRPKFPMDLSGKGDKNKQLVGAKQVRYMSSQWCVLDPDTQNGHLLPGAMSYACTQSDCTATVKGGSCSTLEQDVRASYVFNMVFQLNDQDVTTCDFTGLGKVVQKNLSTSTCLFPIALDYESAGERLRLPYALSIAAGFLYSFLMLMQ